MSPSKESNLTTYTNTVKTFLKQNFGKEADVVALIPVEAGWKATAELMLDADYTKKLAKDDIMHIFDVVLDECGKVKSYERIGTRKRGVIEEA